MVIVYSNEKIKGLEGRYIAPWFFNENQIIGADKVYTNDSKIEKVCKEKKIKVEKLPKG